MMEKSVNKTIFTQQIRWIKRVVEWSIPTTRFSWVYCWENFSKLRYFELGIAYIPKDNIKFFLGHRNNQEKPTNTKRYNNKTTSNKS